MDRQKKILSCVDPATQLGIEIGPLTSPIVTREMGNIRYVDHASTEDLKQKYADDPSVDISRIVDIDYIWGEKTLPELVASEAPFDYVIASHVIEHVPDFIGWLKEIHAVLKPGGILSLAIPDKRYCFDYCRHLTQPAEMIEAYLEGRRKPSPRQIFDHFASCVSRNGAITWIGAVQKSELTHLYSDEQALNLVKHSMVNSEYVDAHCWVFTPDSFFKLLTTLINLNLLDLKLVKFFETSGCEFYVTLEAVDPHDNLDDCKAIQLQSLPRSNYLEKDPKTQQIQVYEDDDLILAVEHSWSTGHSLGLTGWVLAKKESFEKIEICVDGTPIPIADLYPRPDVLLHYPDYVNADCGFAVQIPRIAQHHANLNVETQAGKLTKQISFEGSKPTPPQGFSQGETLFDEFIQIVNDNQLSVLEIGSRIVAPGSVSKRALFPNAASYTGFDYYPDNNTDIVGDAHQLSSYFNGKRFGAIFSLSVFEHLAMPWLAAREINQLLEVGGITCHMTHNAWPIHEQPWDFWRFSDEALKVLFSPALGFEVLKVGYYQPARIYLDEIPAGMESLPTQPAFGGVVILAKKVADVVPDRFNWNVTVEEILGSGSHYPAPVQQSERRRKESFSEPTSRQFVSPRLQASQEKVKQLRKKVDRLKTRLENSANEMAALEEEIAAMQSSKFWKLRQQWIRLKQVLGRKE